MIKITDIEEGQEFWTCQPDMESESYGRGQVRRPWKGKVSTIYLNRNVHGKPYGSVNIFAYSKHTGEIDEDSNATAHAEMEQIFETEKEALTYYLAELKEKFTSLSKEIKNVEENLHATN